MFHRSVPDRCDNAADPAATWTSFSRTSIDFRIEANALLSWARELAGGGRAISPRFFSQALPWNWVTRGNGAFEQWGEVFQARPS